MTEKQWFERANTKQPYFDKQTVEADLVKSILIDKDITPETRWWANLLLSTARHDEHLPLWIHYIAGAKLEHSQRAAIAAGEEYCRWWLSQNERKANDEDTGQGTT